MPETSRHPALTLCDSATKLDDTHVGAVLLCGSHGGVYPAYLAARHGCHALILNDAGVGRDNAGIRALAYCQAIGMAAATVSYASARIGDAHDMLEHGLISHVNAAAAAAGCAPGQTTDAAMRLMADAPAPGGTPPGYAEARAVIDDAPPAIVCMDSASLVRPVDAGAIVVTGSHGGLVGGDPAMALQVDALAALFNDAGVGPDQVGLGRLPALDKRGIAAATVSAASARIGDGRSTYEDGVLSHVNKTAAAAGAKPGMTARDFVARLRQR